MSLQLYTNPMSRGQIAHWMLEELGQPYETIWLEFGEAGMKSAAYLKVNPMGKVPCVVHAGQVLTEAAAICLYLAEAFPEAKLSAPPSRRADYYRWTLFAAGPLEQAVTAKSLGWEAPQRSQMLGYGSFDDTIRALTQHLEKNPFVCGEVFTAADVYVGSAVQWGLMFKSIPSSPVLDAYAALLAARPARQRAREINDARVAKKAP